MRYINKSQEAIKDNKEKLEKWKEEWNTLFPNSNVTWEDFKEKKFNNYGKKDLYQNLWYEQSGICCYCGQSIPEPAFQSGTTSVEHIITQQFSRTNQSDERLNYENLILSCMGRKYEVFGKNETLNSFSIRNRTTEIIVKKFTKPIVEKEGAIGFLSGEVVCCNLKRGSNSKTIINPTEEQYNTLEKDCWQFFTYDFDGMDCKISTKNKNIMDNELERDTIEVLGLDCNFLNTKRGKLYPVFRNDFLFTNIDELEYDDGSRRRTTKQNRDLEDKKTYFDKKIKAKPLSFYPMFYAMMRDFFEGNII
jgi:uncharacterized protein (TIGR02646 family)